MPTPSARITARTPARAPRDRRPRPQEASAPARPRCANARSSGRAIPASGLARAVGPSRPPTLPDRIRPASRGRLSPGGETRRRAPTPPSFGRSPSPALRGRISGTRRSALWLRPCREAAGEGDHAIARPKGRPSFDGLSHGGGGVGAPATARTRQFQRRILAGLRRVGPPGIVHHRASSIMARS